jgi:hypothetical protein
MTIGDNLETFNGKKIRDFNPETGIEEPEKYVYRLRIDYDAFEEGKRVTDLLTAFYHHPNASRVQELVIGAFSFVGEGGADEIVDSLAAARHQLPGLKALFFGDITYEENEISWIEQGDMGPVLAAYPGLEYFRVRGGNGLSLGKLDHPNLKTLIVETGGLPTNVIEEVGAARLPALEHLELWLGSDHYGFEAGVEDLQPILDGTPFPRLRYLGLRNSVISDDIARALHGAPVLAQLEVLDLSMGTLGDEGAEALLANPAIRRLRMLDVHHHYVSPGLVEKLQGLGIGVDASEPLESDDDDEGFRYVAVSE